jgi:hypothetical protein
MKNIGLLFALATAFTGSAFAQSTTFTRTSDFTFAPVPLASTETIGVNLMNMAANPNNGNASSCTGSVTFQTAAGATIGAATPFTLAANASTSVNLAFSSSGLSGIRGLLRAVVATTTTSGVPCSLSYTLNTFDTSSGVTHIFLVGAAPISVQPLTNPGR